jgi:hypothetical protein
MHYYILCVLVRLISLCNNVTCPVCKMASVSLVPLCTSILYAPCVGFGFRVRLRSMLRSLALCCVCEVAPSFVSGWRSFSSFALYDTLYHYSCRQAASTHLSSSLSSSLSISAIYLSILACLIIICLSKCVTSDTLCRALESDQTARGQLPQKATNNNGLVRQAHENMSSSGMSTCHMHATHGRLHQSCVK